MVFPGIFPAAATISADTTTTFESACSDHSDEDLIEKKDEKTPVVRKFQQNWMKMYSWLEFDAKANRMACVVCKRHKKKNALTGDGSNNFRTSTLTRHASQADHQCAIENDTMKTNFTEAVNKALSQKEEAVMVALKAVYWLAKENLPLHKYESLMEFLAEVNCPNIKSLRLSEAATYGSESTANDLLQSLAAVIRDGIDNMLLRSPFVSIYADESTDIAVQKKLVVYSRVVDPDTFQPSTHFLANMKVANGTAAEITTSLMALMADRGIPVTKVMGLGSDGAAVMTSQKNGVTGKLLDRNPMLVNYHCIAHKLALVTSQAAKAVPYLVKYQDVLTSLFYYFKGSANRTENLKEVQKVLDMPQLKIKEVHEVRWMAIYEAVHSVYHSLDALLTYFRSESDKNAKAKGFQKKMSQVNFVEATYLLKDILPVVTKLCLQFQKKNIDVSMIKVHLDMCRADLRKIKSGDPLATAFSGSELGKDVVYDDGEAIFKGNHVLHGASGIARIKEVFIDQLLEHLDARFPEDDSGVMQAFSVLGLRPITFLSTEDRNEWGNQQIESLISKYGIEQSRDGGEGNVVVPPVINAAATRDEWNLLKMTVVCEGYPRDNMSNLWSLINQYHKDQFPNMMVLSSLALTAPVHTADCERGFSAQNAVKTAHRNRLSASTVNDLLTVSLEGPPLRENNFVPALKHWRSRKDRKLFK